MTIGVGGSTAEAELAKLKSMRGDVPEIGVDERLRRIDKAQRLMREKGSTRSGSTSPPASPTSPGSRCAAPSAATARSCRQGRDRLSVARLRGREAAHHDELRRQGGAMGGR